MATKPQEQKQESITDYLPPRNYMDNYPDTSVEYAFAYALNKIGVKSLRFGSYGPPGRKKAQFNSLEIKSSKKIGDRKFLYALLDLFDISFSGGANSTHQQAFWKKNHPPYKHFTINYRLARFYSISFHFKTDDCSNFALMVNGYLTWLNQKENSV